MIASVTEVCKRARGVEAMARSCEQVNGVCGRCGRCEADFMKTAMAFPNIPVAPHCPRLNLISSGYDW